MRTPVMLLATLLMPIAHAGDSADYQLRLPGGADYRLHQPESPRISEAERKQARREALGKLPFSAQIEAAAEAGGIEPELLHAVVHAESAYNPRAVSPKGALGLAQLMPSTARMYGVSLVRDTVVWGTCPLECRYTQALNGRSWEIVNSGHEAEAFVDGRKVFTAGPGLRITTDLDGNILGTARYLPDADPAQVTPQ